MISFHPLSREVKVHIGVWDKRKKLNFSLTEIFYYQVGNFILISFREKPSENEIELGGNERRRDVNHRHDLLNLLSPLRICIKLRNSLRQTKAKLENFEHWESSLKPQTEFHVGTRIDQNMEPNIICGEFSDTWIFWSFTLEAINDSDLHIGQYHQLLLSMDLWNKKPKIYRRRTWSDFLANELIAEMKSRR